MSAKGRVGGILGIPVSHRYFDLPVFINTVFLHLPVYRSFGIYRLIGIYRSIGIYRLIGIYQIYGVYYIIYRSTVFTEFTTVLQSTI